MLPLFRVPLLAIATLILSATSLAADNTRPLKSFDVPFEMFTLDNGLTVVVSENRALPEVHIEMRYFVGSRDEKPGKTGFAHLFEHLMFNGSENFEGEYLSALRAYGAKVNGSTSPDRTNYYNVVPTNAVERVLFLESDRMGHLLGALTQEKLDEQRGVVQNEKRQGDNAAFGYLQYKVQKALFPEGHPYSWSTIGSMEDLHAATLEDAKEWFRQYYGPSNAAIIFVGDINAATARELTQKYFGDIPPGKAVSRANDLVPVRTQNTSEYVEDPKAKSIRIARYWVAPGVDTRDGNVLDSIADALDDEASEWLYKSLVEGAGVADSVAARVSRLDLASWFSVFVNVKEGVDPKDASAALDEVLARFIDKGPTNESIEGGKTNHALLLARMFETNSARASVLAESVTIAREPDFYKKQLAWYDDSTPEEVRAVAEKWLSNGSHEILVLPYPQKTASTEGVDRSELPEPTGFSPIRIPVIQDTTLDNGIRVRFVETNTSPLVTVSLDFTGGDHRLSAKDKAIHLLMTDLLGTKTRSRSRDEIIRETNKLGMSMGLGAKSQTTELTMISLAATADKSLSLFADIVRYAEFDQDEFDKQLTSRLSRHREVMQGINVASLYREKILFGEGHPYAKYVLDDLRAITREDVENFYRQWVRPDNLLILAAGDSSVEELRELLNEEFGDWKVTGQSVADVDIPLPENPASTRVVLFDLPGAVQSAISAYQIVPGMEELDAAEYARRMAITELTGHFGSRVNSNLREDKGWSYGIGGQLQFEMSPRYWRMSGSVQTDKTVESINEILKEFTAYAGDQPITEEQLNTLRNGDINKLATFATSHSRQMIAYVRGLELSGYEDNYAQKLPDIYNSITTSDVTKTFSSEFDLSRLTWIIVGDLAKIEQAIRDANLGSVEIWGPDGERIR